MATLRLITAEHPDSLAEWACDFLADSDTALLVPGLHPRRRLLERLEAAHPDALKVMGPRILTIADMRRHLGEVVGHQEVLSSIQWDELVRAAILRAAEGEDAWCKGLLDRRGRLPAGMIRRVSQLVAEIMQGDMDALERTQMLASQFDEEMAQGVERLYQDLAERLLRAQATTWLSARHTVADSIAQIPLITPASKWVVLGLDGALPADGEMQMVLGLLANPDVAEVAVGLWAPNDMASMDLEMPGQAAILQELLNRSGGRREILPSRPGSEWARVLPNWNKPLDAPPLVRVDAPDLSIAIEWVMRRIKRRILDGQPMERIGIIAPHSSEATSLAARWANTLGVPLVASVQSRLDRAPIIAVVNALMECASGTWSRASMRTLASHPSVGLPLPMTAIDRASATTNAPTTADAWRSRLQLVMGGDPTASEALGALDLLAGRLAEHCPATATTPAEWVRRVASMLREFRLHRGGVTPEVAREWSEAIPTVRLNGEALNSLWRSLLAWARACEIGGDAEREVSADRFVEVWGRLVSQGVARLSAYPQRGVWLLDPSHLTGMMLDEVYLVDLVEGSWGVYRPSTGFLQDPAIRTRLRLETEDGAIAREQLLFQQALAAIGSTGWLVSHAQDSRGRACSPSPLLQFLTIRHGSIPTERPTAASLLPHSADQVLAPFDVYWWTKATDDPAAPEALEAEAPGAMPGASEDTIFSPSSLEAYATCGHRVQLTQAFGGEMGSEDDEQQAARRLFHALWRAAQAGGDADTEWGEGHEEAIAPVWQSLHRSKEVAAEITVGLREAVKTAWESLRRDRIRSRQPDGPLRTKVLDRAVLLGDPRAPLRLNHDQTSWLLRSEISSIEEIDDPRCVGPLAKLQGLLIIREITWKTDGGARAQANAWLRGDDLGLPLQAALAEERFSRRVWGWERIALLDEPVSRTGFWTRNLNASPDGVLTIVKPGKNAPNDPVREAINTALGVASQRVRDMRAGEYPVTPGFHCGWCPVRRACTHATGQTRAPKQVPVPLRRVSRDEAA